MFKLRYLWVIERLFSWKALILLGFLGVLINFAGVAFLGFYMQLPRIFPQGGLDDASQYDRHLYLQDDEFFYIKELASIIGPGMSQEEKSLAILRWQMNQIPQRGAASQVLSSRVALERGRKGVGLACSEMAQIYRDALLSAGIPSRRVILQRNMFDVIDTHVAVEAWWLGKWHYIDPTYNVVFRDSAGAIASSKQIRMWWLRRASAVLEVSFLGDVLYPARYTEVPFRYENFFNNIYIEIRRSYGFKRLIPVFGVWIGPQWAYRSDENELSTRPQEAYRLLYYFFMIVYPIANLAILAKGYSLARRNHGKSVAFVRGEN